MTRCVSAITWAHDHHGSVNITENQFVMLGWSEIMSGYNNLDSIVDIGSRSRS